jgi:predicted DNA-binding transcriptional regulator AlpA
LRDFRFLRGHLVITRLASVPKETKCCHHLARYIRVTKFAEMTGYSEKAVRRKIEDGVWLEGLEYRRAPDGRVLMDMEGYRRWVEAKGALAFPRSERS